MTVKTGKKKISRKAQDLRDAQQVKIKAEADFRGSRIHLDDLQEKARYQILTLIPDDTRIKLS